MLCGDVTWTWEFCAWSADSSHADSILSSSSWPVQLQSAFHVAFFQKPGNVAKIPWKTFGYVCHLMSSPWWFLVILTSYHQTKRHPRATWQTCLSHQNSVARLDHTVASWRWQISNPIVMQSWAKSIKLKIIFRYFTTAEKLHKIHHLVRNPKIH